jgi:hypothetical protein
MPEFFCPGRKMWITGNLSEEIPLGLLSEDCIVEITP